MAKELINQYTQKELENIVKHSKSMREVMKKIGYSTLSGGNSKTVKNKISQYNIDTSHFTSSPPTKRTANNVFQINSSATQAVLRRWYKNGQYTEYKCAICGQSPEWNGHPLTLILDHKWCIKYNLPYKKREIIQYTDEEWQLI